MAPLHVGPDAGLELGVGPPFRDTVREDLLVDLRGREAPRPPDHDLVTVGVPLDDRPGADSEPAAHLGRHGDLPLRGQARLGDLGFSPGHADIITEVMSRVKPHGLVVVGTSGYGTDTLGGMARRVRRVLIAPPAPSSP